MLRKREVRAQIVIVENGKYILLQHHHKNEERYFWGLPGGGKEEGETIEAAAIREAKEETGLEIKLLPFRYDVGLPLNERLYKRKVTFVGYPVRGVASTGYDPEEDMRLLFELVDIKWQDIDDLETIDDVARSDIIPVRNFLYKNRFIQRAGMLVFKLEDNKIKYLVISLNQKSNKFIFPQGYVNKAETKEQAAIRETEEAAGIDAKLIKKLGFFFYEADKKIYQTTIYLAVYIKKAISEELRNVKWITYDEMKIIDLPKETRRFIEDFHHQFIKEGENVTT